MEKSELKEFSKDDQKLIKEFLENEQMELEEIECTESEFYDTEALLIEASGNSRYYIVRDYEIFENNVRDFLRFDAVSLYFYTESIKAGKIDPVQTCFKDWIDEIIKYDGLGTICSSYDGSENEISGKAMYFRTN
jgi:hypothetical protein